VFEEIGPAHQREQDLSEARTAFKNAENFRRGVIVLADAVIANDFKNDLDAAHKNLAECLRRVGDMEYELGDAEIGYGTLKESIGILRELRRRMPKESKLGVLSGTLVTWADLLNARSKAKEPEELLREDLEIRRAIMSNQHKNLDAKGDVAFVLQRLASCVFDQRRYAESLQLARERLQLRREFYSELPDAFSSERLVSALGSMSFYLLFERSPDTSLPARPDEVLQLAREALELDPSQSWIRTNQAHGLLFSGRYDEAVEVYTKYSQEKHGDKTLGHEMLEDFNLLRQAGIEGPDMLRIEALLKPREEAPGAD